MPKILIADDDFSIGMEIEEMLIALGYDVVEQAGSGQQAVEMARDHKPDIILMDIAMPGEMNGIEAAEKIKAELDIPIVFITGYGDPEYIEKAKEIEPFGYVMKPFDEEEIRAFIEIALHKKAMELKLKKANEQLNHANRGLKREINERKKIEKALRESENLYRDIFEKNNAIKWVIDPSSGKIVDANPAACEFYQYSHEEITKLRVYDINILGEADLKMLLASAESDEKTEFTFKHRLASGEIRHVQVYTGKLETGGKKLLHSIIVDITARKQAEAALQRAHDKLEQRVEDRTAELVEANEQLREEIIERGQVEEALRESEAKYRSMMEAMKDPVYICSQDYRVEYMNPAMVRRTGRDATGEFCFKALHDLDEECPWCMHDNAQAGECIESETVSPKNNRSYHVSLFPILHEDGSISKIAILRDTTELKETEARLQQAQKMAAIGTLAGGIAHDFNNVLYAIMGYTDLTIDLVPEGSKAQRNLQEVLKASDRAKEMVQQILSFSRQSKKEKKPINVQFVLKEAIKLVRTSLPSSIEIRQNIDEDCGPIMADLTQIHEIIMNLAANAYHAMRKKGGVFEVNLRSVECGMRNGDLTENEEKTKIRDSKYKIEDPDLHPGPYLKLTIKDTGHGMDSSVMEKIFDPYFTTKGVGEGTGMGLAVVYGIVKDHGGDIRVSSEPGKGTAFHIYLPLIETGIVGRKIISSEEQASTGTGNVSCLWMTKSRSLIWPGRCWSPSATM